MSRVVMCRQGLSVPRDPRVWREAVTLQDAGHQVTVIAPRDRGQRAREVVDGIAIRRYRTPIDNEGFLGLALESLAALVGCGRHLVGLRLRGRVDVVHAFNPPDTLALLVYLAPRARLVYDQADPVPELLRARGGAPRLVASALAWLELRCLRRADVVLAVNNSCRRVALMRGGLTDDRVVVVRIGPTRLPHTERVDPSPPVVAFGGVMGVQDGVEMLFRAAADVLARRPGLFRLDLIGDGPDVPRLKALAKQLGLADAATWVGWLPGDAFHERLSQATVCVSPDVDTEFNRLATMVKITDYLAAGSATIAADLPETRVTCGDAVMYFPPGDTKALASVLERAIDDEPLRRAYADRARERATRLTWDHSAERLVAVYASMLYDAAPVLGDQSV